MVGMKAISFLFWIAIDRDTL